MTRVCGHCYLTLRPTEYEPETFITGTCDMCGDETFVHRVRREEVETWRESRTVRTGARVLMVYPAGDADYVEVLALDHDTATVRLPDGETYTTVIEDLGLGVDETLPVRFDDGCTDIIHK